MEDMTADEVAAAYVAMGHSVDEVNSSKGDKETNDEFAARKAATVSGVFEQYPTTLSPTPTLFLTNIFWYSKVLFFKEFQEISM